MKGNIKKLKATNEILSDPKKKENRNLSEGKNNKNNLLKSASFIFN